ncbi:MAG: PspC family transcriptional regulator [Chitinophagaceae bacterium]|nr:MAG: PspC family transcriptional regulator [Chitinophagaceae bacterium]
MNRLRNYIEWQVFGVCTSIGELMGVSTFTIRKYFIYISCLTLGSPIVIYFFVAFWMNLKQYILQGKRNPLKYH